MSQRGTLMPTIQWHRQDNSHAGHCSAPPRMKASCSALTCSRSCRQYLQSGLSPYLQIPACPSDIHKLWYAPKGTSVASQASHSLCLPSGACESQLLRTACSRSCRQYLQSGLSPYLQIPACPSDIHKLWYAPKGTSVASRASHSLCLPSGAFKVIVFARCLCYDRGRYGRGSGEGVPCHEIRRGYERWRKSGRNII